PSGSAPFTLSVLAGGGTGIGTTAEQGLASTISLARTADRRGFRRFWMSEHHAMPALSVASPPLMIARLIAETSRIRLGAGGIMLPNHAPLGRRRAVRNAHGPRPAPDRPRPRARPWHGRCDRTGVAPRSQRQRWVPSTGHRVARLPDRRVPRRAPVPGRPRGPRPVASRPEPCSDRGIRTRDLDAGLLTVLGAVGRATRPALRLRPAVRQRRHRHRPAHLPRTVPTLRGARRAPHAGERAGRDQR